jgi:RNA polymerase sigma-70 factor (ECF subfamily)
MDEERAVWLRALASGRLEASRPALEPSLALTGALADAVALGQATWPRIALDPAAFARHIGRVLDVDASAARDAAGVVSGVAAAAGLAALHTGDLFLACAAACGIPQAIAELDARYIRPLPFILGGTGALAGDADSVCSILRERLVVGEAGQPPRIASYGGRGPLAAWIAIAAQRTAISLDRREGALQRAHDRAMSEAIGTELDPELRHMKARYKGAVEGAFRDALGELGDRERAILRLGLVGGLSLDSIAASYNVNTSTVSRWLAKIRQGLLDRTLALLRERLRLSDPEAVSIARLVTSQIDVSVIRFL